MNGGLIIEEISDETLKEQINEFKEFYEKAVAAKDAIDDLTASIANLAKQKFDNVKEEFEGFVSEIDHFTTLIDQELSHVENMGKIAGKSFYYAKIEQSEQKINDLYSEREALVSAMAEAEANGIEEGSADWVSMRNDIYALDEEIQQLGFDIEELEQKIIEVDKLTFDNLKSQFEGFTSELEHFVSMVDKELSHVENMGKIAGKSFYQAKIDLNTEKIADMNKERETLYEQLLQAEEDGLEKGSEDWLAMRDDIYALDEAIADATYEVEELKVAMDEVAKTVFDNLKDRFDSFTSEIDHFISMVDKELSHVQNMGQIGGASFYNEKIDLNAQKLAVLNKEREELYKKFLDVDSTSTEWTAMRDELYALDEAIRDTTYEMEELKLSIDGVTKLAFDDLKSQFETFSSELEHFNNMVEKELTHVQNMGNIAGSSFYEQQIDLDTRKLETLRKEREELAKQFNNANKNSDDWVTMRDELYSLDETIRDVTYEIEELQVAINNVSKQAFDDLKTQFENFSSELQHFNNIVEKELSHVQNMGKIAGESFYNEKMELGLQKLEVLNKEREKLYQQFTNADKSSSDWVTMRDELYALDEAIQDTTYEVEELQLAIDNISKLTFDDLKSQFENFSTEVDHFTSVVDKELNHIQNMGKIAGESFYNKKMELGLQKLEVLNTEREKLYQQFINADRSSSEWVTMRNELYSLDESIIDTRNEVEELQVAIDGIAKTAFDSLKSQFETFTSELGHFINMVDNELTHVQNMGKIGGKSFYNEKIDLNIQRLEVLNKEREKLYKQFSSASKTSSEWATMRDELYALDEEIASTTYEIKELKKALSEVAKQNFDDLKLQFEQAMGVINNQKSLTDSVVSLTEEYGYIASQSYYKALIEGSKTTVKALESQYNTLSKTLADAIASGDVEKYSENWYSMTNDIAEVKNQLVEAADAVVKYANALQQIQWDIFDRGLDGITKLVDETEFFIDLFSHEDLFNKDTAAWTNAGTATRGLMVEEYQAYIDQANAYGKQADEIRKLLETDPKNTKLLDRYQELLNLQRQAILNTKEEKEKIKDLYKEGYDKLVDILDKLIDEYKEALDAAEDLRDFENDIAEKTKAVTDIQKQLSAYQGDDSEETRATLQRLNSDLIDAQKDLEETERQKYIRDQENLLDDFMDTLQDWIEDRLNNIDSLISDAIKATNDNGKTIDSTINETANDVQYAMTEEFANIWSNYSAADGLAASQLDILTLTNDVTNSVREKMNELPTEVDMEAFFDDETVRLLESLTSVDSNILNTIDAISITNEGVDNVNSNIVEFSGYMGERLDNEYMKLDEIDANIVEFSGNMGERLDNEYNSLEELKQQLSEVDADIVEFSGYMGEKLDTQYNSLEELKYQLNEIEARIVEFSGDMGERLDAGTSVLDDIRAVLDNVRVDIAEFSGDLGQRIDNGNDLLTNLENLVEDVDRDVVEFSGELGERIESGIDVLSDGADGIQAEIEEWSGYLGHKIDNVADAIHGLDLNVEVNVDASTGSSDVSASGGDSSGGGSSTTTTTDNYGSANTDTYRVYNNDGTVYGGLYTTKSAADEALQNFAKNYAIDQLGHEPNGSDDAKKYNQYYNDFINTHKVDKGTLTYKRGGLIGKNNNFLDAIAQLLGEDHMIAAREGERVLTEDQNKSFEKMVNANFTPLEGSLRDKYSMLSGSNGKDIASMVTNMPVPNVGNVSNVGNTNTFGDINISLPNVTTKEEFVQWLKNDSTIEKIIQSFTVGRMMGGSSYAKMKY